MEDKENSKQNKNNKSKEDKIQAKSYKIVDSKDKDMDIFNNIKEIEKKLPKENKTKDDIVKGTITINKKVEAKKEKTKKSKGIKGKLIALVIAIIIIAVIIIGILFFLKTPYFAVMKTFNSMKSENIKGINEYISYDELMGSLVKSLNIGEEMSDLEKNCFSDFTYKINTVTVEGNIAIVNVDTTNKNFRNALTKWNQKIYQKFINGEEISNSQGITLLNECLSDSSIGTISTNNKDLTLNKIDGKWKLVVDTNLQEAIFPGRSDLANSIDTLINE